eukprot:CAMPEP_0204831754 /NCGR_PEP_ID=MMETSP1346-20131115/11523_1 /ASSEMBLY_ACC=CAM_ASM_000771 /TAXON_ID=215587 /ORGANISM="Aplanochytrium stocchinoi, Strain GSBS06" /LENGTH=60 /DNA_ID=CAMNT_0051963037 /DNA_START=1680 /DNA_END=1862 /DNA_ORIENTATION=+
MAQIMAETSDLYEHAVLFGNIKFGLVSLKIKHPFPGQIADTNRMFKPGMICIHEYMMAYP